MIKLILFALGLALNAQAQTYRGVYDGEQVQLSGFTLVEGAKAGDFYYLPNLYRIKSGSRFDAKTNDYLPEYGVVHEVKEIDGIKYSIYNLRFSLRKLSTIEGLTAAQNLELRIPGATLKGMAVPCGMTLSVPGFGNNVLPPESDVAPKPNPNATYVQYSISTAETGKCEGFDNFTQTDINVIYRVPLSMEPFVARSLTSGTGIVIPPMTLLFPYKYTDSFSIDLSKESAMKELKLLADFKGTIKAVQARVKASMTEIFKSSKINGSVKMDCRSGEAICGKYFEWAKSMVEARLLTYTPIKSDSKELTIGDSDKEVAAFKVGLGFDQTKINDNELFHFDFSNVVYSSVPSLVHFRASNVPVEVLAEEVRKMVEGAH